MRPGSRHNLINEISDQKINFDALRQSK